MARWSTVANPGFLPSFFSQDWLKRFGNTEHIIQHLRRCLENCDHSFACIKAGGHLQHLTLRHPKHTYSASRLNWGWRRGVGKAEGKTQQGVIQQRLCSGEAKAPVLNGNFVHMLSQVLHTHFVMPKYLYINKFYNQLTWKIDSWFWCITP